MPLSLPFPFPAKHLTGSSPNNSLTFFISFSEFETTDVRLCILTWVRTLPDAPSSLDKSHCHLFHTTDTTVMLRPLGQTGPISKMTYTVSSGTLNSTIPYHTIPDWPRGQNFGFGLASVLLTWSGKYAVQCKIILLVAISWLYHCNIHYKDVVNVTYKFSRVLLALSSSVLFRKIYLWPASAWKTWPRPWPRGSGLVLGLGVKEFWPRRRRFVLV